MAIRQLVIVKWLTWLTCARLLLHCYWSGSFTDLPNFFVKTKFTKFKCFSCVELPVRAEAAFLSVCTAAVSRCEKEEAETTLLIFMLYQSNC